MAVSKARIRASNKYNKANYRQLKINVKPADYELVDTYCKENSISKASMILHTIKYCIENDINLK